MERAWARRERRESERFAVVAYCMAASAGSKVTLEDIREMMPMPPDPDKAEEGCADGE